jgi:carboxylate-amine ligase
MRGLLDPGQPAAAVAGFDLVRDASGALLVLEDNLRMPSGAAYASPTARREPTFGLHVHVGVPDAEAAIHAGNRLRTHIPLLLALSVNSPFWQGRDTGLASARTPLFQAFPRVGIPRAFADYAEYVEAVDVLIRCDAVPEPTFLWWDVRPQPRFGTVELRIMDAQTTLADAAALAALMQCIVRLEVEEGEDAAEPPLPQEVLAENRFLAARDGMDAELIEPGLGRRVPARGQLDDLVVACRPHAEDLDCAAELDRVASLGERTGAKRQLEQSRSLGSLPRLVGVLADDFFALPSRVAAGRTG